MPDIWSQKFLGSFTNCKDAVDEAKKLTQQQMAVIIVPMNVITDNQEDSRLIERIYEYE